MEDVSGQGCLFFSLELGPFEVKGAGARDDLEPISMRDPFSDRTPRNLFGLESVCTVTGSDISLCQELTQWRSSLMAQGGEGREEVGLTAELPCREGLFPPSFSLGKDHPGSRLLVPENNL